MVLHDINDSDDVAHVVQQLMESISNPLDVGPAGMAITASIGVAVYPQDGLDANSLLRNSEAASTCDVLAMGMNSFCTFSPRSP